MQLVCLHTCQTDRSFRSRQIPVSSFPGQRDGAQGLGAEKGPSAAAMPEEEVGKREKTSSTTAVFVLRDVKDVKVEASRSKRDPIESGVVD